MVAVGLACILHSRVILCQCNSGGRSAGRIHRDLASLVLQEIVG